MSTLLGYRMLSYLVVNDVIKMDPPQIYGRFVVRLVLAVCLLLLLLHHLTTPDYLSLS